MDARLTSALNRLWSDNRPTLSSGGAAALQYLTQRYQVSLPEDFAAYIGEALPDIDWTDADGIIWWPRERIKSLGEECGAVTPDSQRNPDIEAERDKYLVFADYLDWCYAYAICCSDGPNRGKVALIGVEPDRFVASSFLSFVNLAADGSDRLHSPIGDRFTDLI